MRIRISASLKRRFWAKVRKSSDCWRWTAAKKNGYGVIGIGRADEGTAYAHVVSWVIHNGRQVPKGKCVLHDCDNRPCVRPSHLAKGTKAKNSRDMISRGRAATGVRHGTKTSPQSIRRGTDRPNAKLDWNKVAQIRSAYEAGTVSQQNLADTFGVSVMLVNGIVNGSRWVASELLP